jgi:hypothetical protein
MYLRQDRVMGIPKKRILNQRAMVFWIYMMIYLLLHIYKQVGVLVGLTPKELNTTGVDRWMNMGNTLHITM